jgi:hypothetical protein
LWPYTKDRSAEPATLIPLAIKAEEHQLDEFTEAGERLMEDPLLCVALAFMLKHACRCAEKVHEKHGFDNDKENEAADWWKTSQL